MSCAVAAGHGSWYFSLELENEDRIGELIQWALDTGAREEEYMVFLLSGPKDDTTVRWDAPIVNDKVTFSDRPWVWTMSQRHTSLAALTRPGMSRTNDLEQTRTLQMLGKADERSIPQSEPLKGLTPVGAPDRCVHEGDAPKARMSFPWITLVSSRGMLAR